MTYIYFFNFLVGDRMIKLRPEYKAVAMPAEGSRGKARQVTARRWRLRQNQRRQGKTTQGNAKQRKEYEESMAGEVLEKPGLSRQGKKSARQEQGWAKNVVMGKVKQSRIV